MNARLLLQAGFVNQEMAGVYSYLPLGLRMLNNIERIVVSDKTLAGKKVELKARTSETIELLILLQKKEAGGHAQVAQYSG